MDGLARWLPRSLFGRLMLVLAAGLALAQGLSAVINVAERDQLVRRSFGMQPADGVDLGLALALEIRATIRRLKANAL